MEQPPMGQAVAELDRHMALRMIAPSNEIPAECLEAYWTHWKAESDRCRDAFRIVAREFEALELGEAVFRLPDDSRWVSAGALLDLDVYDDEPKGDNTFLWYLHRILVDHKTCRPATAAGVSECGHARPVPKLLCGLLELAQSGCERNR